jgi:hypothetical protein
MKTFNVFKHPDKGFEAVKVGFSWPAFFFGILWMIAKKLWALAGLYFILTIVCSFFDAVVDQLEAGGGQVIIYLFVMAGSLALLAGSWLQGQQVARRKSSRAWLRAGHNRADRNFGCRHCASCKTSLTRFFNAHLFWLLISPCKIDLGRTGVFLPLLPERKRVGMRVGRIAHEHRSIEPLAQWCFALDMR